MGKYKKICIIVVVLIGLGILIHFLFKDGAILLKTLTDFKSMKILLESYGSSSMFVGILLYALQIMIAILPGEIIEVLFGVLYGSWGGMLFCIIGNCIGSIAIFYFTKRYGSQFVKRFISEEKMNKIKLFQNPKKLNVLTFLLFLIPGTPKDLFTYCLGLTPMKCSTFLLITSVARIPSIYSSTLVGANLGNNMIKEAIMIYFITGVLSLVGYLYYRNRFTKKA